MQVVQVSKKALRFNAFNIIVRTEHNTYGAMCDFVRLQCKLDLQYL